MFCPLIPGLFNDASQFDRLLEMAVSWNAEAIWTEPLNARSDGIPQTAMALRRAGCDAYAKEVDAVRNRRRWSQYATWLTKEVQAAARRADLIEKLIILNYRSKFQPEDQQRINSDPQGVIWL